MDMMKAMLQNLGINPDEVANNIKQMADSAAKIAATQERLLVRVEANHTALMALHDKLDALTMEESEPETPTDFRSHVNHG